MYQDHIDDFIWVETKYAETKWTGTNNLKFVFLPWSMRNIRTNYLFLPTFCLTKAYLVCVGPLNSFSEQLFSCVLCCTDSNPLTTLEKKELVPARVASLAGITHSHTYTKLSTPPCRHNSDYYPLNWKPIPANTYTFYFCCRQIGYLR